MEQVGHVWRARPGKIDEYRKVHATVWPEVEDALRRAGVGTYIIYVWGDYLFSYMEVDDYERMVEQYNQDPAARKWEEQVGDLIEFIEADPETGWPVVLPRVWALGTGDE